MTDTSNEQADSAVSRLAREGTWLTAFLLVGLVMLPAAIYLVGRAVFGDYGNGGIRDFYVDILGRFLSGDPAVLFLLLSPYLLWLLCRLTVRGFRHLGRSRAAAP